jgi:hypothetical protein
VVSEGFVGVDGRILCFGVLCMVFGMEDWLGVDILLADMINEVMSEFLWRRVAL